MQRSEKERPTPPKCAVLVVEDDQDIQRLLQVILHRHCSSVDVAGDGERAIEMLKTATYGLAILDLMLPKINGFEVAQFARSLPNPPKLIIISAIARYVHDRLPEGAVLLQKPFELEQIEEALRSLEVI